MRLMTPKIARKSPKMETNCASQSLRNAGSAKTSRRLGLGAAAAVAIFGAIVLQFAVAMREFPQGTAAGRAPARTIVKRKKRDAFASLSALCAAALFARDLAAARLANEPRARDRRVRIQVVLV